MIFVGAKKDACCWEVNIFTPISGMRTRLQKATMATELLGTKLRWRSLRRWRTPITSKRGKNEDNHNCDQIEKYLCLSSEVQAQSSKFKYCFRTSAFEKKNTTKMDLKRTQFGMEDYLNSSRRGGLLFSYYMTYFTILCILFCHGKLSFTTNHHTPHAPFQRALNNSLFCLGAGRILAKA